MVKKNKKLSKDQSHVLDLLTSQFLTIKQVAVIRKTSVQAVYKIVRKLKKKGLLYSRSGGFNRGFKKDISTHIKPKQSGIRLHGQEFNIKILYKDHRYVDIMKKSNIIYIEDHTIRLYRNSIEIYANKSFWGEDENRATYISLEYWTKFFFKLEEYLKIILIKPRRSNIKLVNQHYADVNNEIAESSIEKQQHIRIYSKEDGKLRFLIDNSLNLKEAETVHPIDAKEDMTSVKTFLTDLIENPTTFSDLKNIIKANSISINKLSNNMSYFGENMVSHVNAIKGIKKATENNNKVIKELSETMVAIRGMVSDLRNVINDR